jgi:hypothetical protein
LGYRYERGFGWKIAYETSAHKIQTPGNYPEENIQHTEHGESLKSSGNMFFAEGGQI